MIPFVSFKICLWTFPFLYPSISPCHPLSTNNCWCRWFNLGLSVVSEISGEGWAVSLFFSLWISLVCPAENSICVCVCTCVNISPFFMLENNQGFKPCVKAWVCVCVNMYFCWGGPWISICGSLWLLFTLFTHSPLALCSLHSVTHKWAWAHTHTHTVLFKNVHTFHSLFVMRRSNKLLWFGKGTISLPLCAWICSIILRLLFAFVLIAIARLTNFGCYCYLIIIIIIFFILFYFIFLAKYWILLNYVIHY